MGSIPITRSNCQPDANVKRFLKFIAIVVGVLVILIVVAALVLPLVINPNKFKPQIVHAVKERTGRELNLQGNIHLSVFPWIGLKLGKTELSNAPGFGKRPFARVNSVDVSVALLPLLHNKKVIRKVALDGVELNLARDRHGRNNWDDMVRASQRGNGGRAQVPTQGTSPAAAAGALATIRIDGIDVSNGTFRWDDERASQSYTVDRLELHTGAIAPGKPVDLRLAFDLRSGKPVLRTRVDLRSKLTVDPNKQTLRARDTELKLGPLSLHTDLDAHHLLGKPDFNGKISIGDFSPAALLKQLGIHYDPVDSSALGRANLSANLRGTPSSIYLDKMHLRLDDTVVTGSASARFASLPAIDFNLSADGIDLDRYLPKATGEKAAKKRRGGAAAVVVPVPLIKEMNVHGALHVGKLKAFGIRSTDISARVAAKNGFTTIGPNTARLYSGRYLGKTTVDVRKGAPRFTMDERLEGIQLGGFLKDAGIFDRFEGTGDVRAKLSAHGLDADDILHSLDGTASVSLKNGTLHGVDVYNTVVNSCETGSYAAGEAGAATPFASLHASAKLNNGVADNRDLRLAGRLFQVSGAGKVNLGRGTIDYLAEVRLLEQTKCPLSIFHIPLNGKLAELNAGKIIHDAVGYELQQAAKREVQKKIDEEKAKIQRQMQQQIRKQFGL